MKAEEYIETLTEQIRCRKAREGVAREIAAHIADQAQAFEKEGIDSGTAEEKAVKEMGDPVAAGMALDRIHRPQFDWKMLVMVLLFSIAGCFIMFTSGGMPDVPGAFGRQMIWTIAGFGVMTAVCLIDYRIVSHYAGLLYIGMTVIFLAYSIFGHRINGRVPALNVLVYLYVPVYTGVLYQLRGQRVFGVIKAGALLLLTTILSSTCAGSAFAGFNIVVLLSGILLFAIAKKWFAVSRRKAFLGILAIWIFFIGFVLWNVFARETFRGERLRAFLSPYSYQETTGYLYTIIREKLSNARILGKTAPANDLVLGNQNLIVLQMICSYGILSGIAVAAAFLCLCLHSYRIVRTQKNQLGMMVSAACMLTILCICTEGILLNLGLWPSTTISYPFLSYGGSATLTYAVLIGLLMSCHRYEKIVVDEITNKKPAWHLHVKIERH